MKKTLSRLMLAFFFIGSTTILSAQNNRPHKLDSMLTLLKTMKEDTSKVALLSQISFMYSQSDVDSGLLMGTQALDLAKKLNWEKGIGNGLYFRGANYLNMGKLPEASDDYLGALKYFEKVDDKAKIAGTLSNLGGIYSYQGKDEKALEYFNRALKLNRQYYPKSNFEVANLMNISIIYYNKKEYDQALPLLNEAEDIIRKKNYVNMKPSVEVNLATIYLEKGNLSKAINFALSSKELSESMGDLSTMANGLQALGVAYYRLGNGEDSKLLDSLFRGDKKRALAEAQSKLDSSVALLEEVGDMIMLAESYNHLSSVAEAKGDFKRALEYEKLYKSTNDSVVSSDKNEKILQSSLQYDFEKKEAATKAEQEKRDLRQRIVRNSIGAGLAGALIFLVVVYRQRNRINKEKQRSEELLLNILPQEVAEELKQKGSAEAKQFDDVTVMFTDFKGFTQISENLSPAELVAEIHTCFKAFDDIIGRHNIEKIKTIGDSYMCAGGLPITNKSHASDVVKAALEIQQFMQSHLDERKREGKVPFEIRIGVHTGPVVAGIVGVKKFAYDIWGDTVNIASRMESSGEAGKVNISGTTYAVVKDHFKCRHRGKIQAKNKGEIDMYFVE